MSKVIEQVEELALPVVQELGLELVDIEFLKEGRDWFLRVYIDTPEGNIDIDQCAQVSERLSEELDRTDPIPQNYFLEVSSPGAERPLKKEEDYEKAVGRYIYVKTYEPVDGMKEFEGHLIANAPDVLEMQIRIKTRTLTVSIAKDKIAVARYAIDFSA
ncbi:ribosome maturation factor RimP [Sporosarcina sp. NCCP-2716]|uniref:ribosome maturation factor RimP n=1 Tax=Sporosarcina sp. NCCP-2716 TaxID=2943679 RepID=UPI00203D0583|nr:ribosome maturation factor RimP [Sporosarcina sp. NCCP-2716]GKV67836.1 ribosome maturation factor RimP [Sporosarcina sp. NCCP-2716]